MRRGGEACPCGVRRRKVSRRRRTGLRMHRGKEEGEGKGGAVDGRRGGGLGGGEAARHDGIEGRRGIAASGGGGEAARHHGIKGRHHGIEGEVGRRRGFTGSRGGAAEWDRAGGGSVRGRDRWMTWRKQLSDK